MKRFFIVLALIVAVLGIGYAYRGTLREWYRQSTSPTLPAAETYDASSLVATSVSAATTSSVKATSIKPTPSKPTTKDPFAWSGTFPAEKNLAVPFLSQAPKQNWNLPYQEACEEAASIMVNAYYQGKKTAFTPDEGDTAILDLVAFEKRLLGKYEDTTAEETAAFIRAYFHRNVIIKQSNDPLDIKRAIANGFPVIIPANGKTLANPNFRNGGPVYHMLVIKGWTKDGHWITNDPGTRLGADFLYTQENIQASMHDWNGGDVPNGKPEILVVMP